MPRVLQSQLIVRRNSQLCQDRRKASSPTAFSERPLFRTVRFGRMTKGSLPRSICMVLLPRLATGFSPPPDAARARAAHAVRARRRGTAPALSGARRSCVDRRATSAACRLRRSAGACWGAPLAPQRPLGWGRWDRREGDRVSCAHQCPRSRVGAAPGKSRGDLFQGWKVAPVRARNRRPF
jgi:hypothetical protein